MFLDSGIGLHNTSYMIDATEDKWAAAIKKDPFARSLKNKSFPFYNDWKEIFGKDRATGENSQTFVDTADFQSDLRAENSSGTKSTGKKRKMHDETDERFIEAINLFSEKSDSRFGEMSLQMADLTQHVGDGARLQYLCKNSDKLDLFFSLPDNAKIVLVRKILNTR
ncbi:hypothetical protein ACS0TY_004114 [Phlomoides rotata]